MMRVARLIKSQIGRGGGFTLARPATDISVGEVVRLTEGRFQMAECFSTKKSSNCPLVSICRLKCVFQQALNGLLTTLDSYTLENIMENRSELLQTCLAADLVGKAGYSAALRIP